MDKKIADNDLDQIDEIKRNKFSIRKDGLNLFMLACVQTDVPMSVNLQYKI